MPTWRRSWLLARVLTVALLVGQAGAAVHAYSHASDDPGERQGIARNCGLCLASSQLQHAVAPPAIEEPARALTWAVTVAAPRLPEFASAPFRAFRSRAPPSFV